MIGRRLAAPVPPARRRLVDACPHHQSVSAVMACRRCARLIDEHRERLRRRDLAEARGR